ncbi:MAG: energy transducer TonB, partial [Longimicrobiales bacterium]
MSGLVTDLLHGMAGVGELASTAAIVACGGVQDVESPSPLMAGVSIEYHMELWDQGIEGTCLVKVRVNEMGGVDSVLVVESSGHAAFDSA